MRMSMQVSILQTGKELYYINGEDGSRETTTNSAAANKTIIGSIEPKVQGGLTNYVSWKFIDFNYDPDLFTGWTCL